MLIRKNRQIQHIPHKNNKFPHFSARVLLVEDSLVNQDVAVATLELFGCQVTVADDGQKALAAVHETNVPFDIIFMDCELPIMDGYKTTKNIRQWERETNKKHTPIVALTAHMLQENWQKCSDAGMDDFLKKPFTQADMGTMLNLWTPQTRLDAVEDQPSGPPSLDLSPYPNKVVPHPLPLSNVNPVGNMAFPVPVFDPVALGHIVALAGTGNKNLIVEIVSNYLTHTPGILTNLAQAFANNDTKEVRVIAHSLKSSSLTMGLARMAALGQAIETEHADLELAHTYFQESGPIFAEAERALKGLLPLGQPTDQSK